MTAPAATPTTYRPIDLRNVAEIPQWETLDPDVRDAISVVGEVLPFRTNQYVIDHLIDWSRVPDDPIFQLVFPQQAVLKAEEFSEIQGLLRHDGRGETLATAVNRIRMSLNPHPAGQLSHNVQTLDGRRLQGLQHKYRETVLFFPAPGQTCHAYCTYCFRWAQFVGLEGLKFQTEETGDLVAYLKAHPEVTDVLVTGGDPMIMRSSVLRKYIEPLLAPELDHIQNIRIGTKALAYWPQRFVTDRDANDCLQLFEEVIAAGRHMAIMGHYAHPVELEPEISREAVRRIRSTGAQIRMQAPLIRHVNDDPEAWATLYRTGVRLGLHPVLHVRGTRYGGAELLRRAPRAVLRDLHGSVPERLGVIPLGPRALHVGLSWQGAHSLGRVAAGHDGPHRARVAARQRRVRYSRRSRQADADVRLHPGTRPGLGAKALPRRVRRDRVVV